MVSSNMGEALSVSTPPKVASRRCDRNSARGPFVDGDQTGITVVAILTAKLKYFEIVAILLRSW